MSVTSQATSGALLTACTPTAALGGQASHSVKDKDREAQRSWKIGPGSYKYKMIAPGLTPRAIGSIFSEP